MKCPKCDSDMEKVTIENLELDRCIACNGIWFDEFELDDDDDETLGINCNIMSRFLATRCDGHSITISTTANHLNLILRS